MKKLVLTSVNQLIQLLYNNKHVADNVPQLKPILEMSPSSSPKKSCNCGSKTNFTTPDANKQVAESILSRLSTEDYVKIKTALNLEQICYYKRSTETNSLVLHCV